MPNNKKGVYIAVLEMKKFTKNGYPIGKIQELDATETIMADSDNSAIEKAHKRADVAESLRSLTLSPTERAMKVLVRVKTVTRQGPAPKTIFFQDRVFDFSRQ